MRLPLVNQLILISALTLLVSRWSSAAALPSPADHGWPVYGGDFGTTKFSPLQQINRDNVRQLQPAWIFHTGDQSGRSTIECNPLVIDGVVYLTTVTLKAVALEAATGRKLWEFDPQSATGESTRGVNRGLSFWTDGTDRRILYPAARHLFCLDAATGKPAAGFGKSGFIDLREGFDQDIFFSPSARPRRA